MVYIVTVIGTHKKTDRPVELKFCVPDGSCPGGAAIAPMEDYDLSGIEISKVITEDIEEAGLCETAILLEVKRG